MCRERLLVKHASKNSSTDEKAKPKGCPFFSRGESITCSTRRRSGGSTRGSKVHPNKPPSCPDRLYSSSSTASVERSTALMMSQSVSVFYIFCRFLCLLRRPALLSRCHRRLGLQPIPIEHWRTPQQLSCPARAPQTPSGRPWKLLQQCQVPRRSSPLEASPPLA